jgi:DNA-directed RNA polymerase specialized sigma24 family protein
MNLSWQRHHSNHDMEMHRLYAKRGLSLMRIAKRFDCRVSEVRGAIARQRARLRMWASRGGQATKRLRQMRDR